MNNSIMNKSKFLGAILSATALLTLGACSGDEFASNENGQQADGRPAIAFDGTRSLEETKKTYYGTLEGSTVVFWSNADRITVYSPASARWTAQQGVYSSSFSYVSGDAIGWNVGDATQDVYMYYPANSDYISGIGAANGSATFEVPANQSAMATIRPTDASDGAHPLSFFMAARKNMTVSPGSPVSFTFNDFMNVLRMNITNPERYTIKSVKITSATANQRVAGKVTVTPITSSTFDYNVTEGSNELTVNPASGTQSLGMFFYDMYLLPQNYTSGVTFTITYDDGVDANKELTRTTSSFQQGTFREIAVTIPASEPVTPIVVVPENSVDMGIRVVSSINTTTGLVLTTWVGKADGTKGWALNGETGVVSDFNSNTVPANAKPLYFATGNMHIDKDATTAELKAGNMGYIEPITSAAAVGAVDYTSTSYGYDTKNYGLFYWGDPIASDTPHADLSGKNVNISGDIRYDIARKQLGNGWRLPTAIEWVFLMEEVIVPTGTLARSWSDYNGYANNTFIRNDGSGFVSNVFTLTSTVTGFTNSLYMPATGWHINAMGRGSNGYYWSGSYGSTVDNARDFFFNTGYWGVGSGARLSAFAIRSVSE